MNTIKVPATLDRLSTLKDGSIKLSFETQEVSPEQGFNLFSMRDKFGWLVFAPTEVEEVIIPDEPAAEFKTDKSPSQRLRGALFKYWEIKGKKGLFDDFYKHKMEFFIELIKGKIN